MTTVRGRKLAAVLASVPLLLLAACGGDEEGGDPGPAEQAGPLSGIPESWLEETAEAWPESAGYASTMPVFEDGDCLLGDEIEVAGVRPEITDVGFGPLGSDRPESYRYVCNIWEEDEYAGELQVINPGDPGLARQIVENSLDDTDIPEQENEVLTVDVDGTEIGVLKRWYPTNPQGMYLALYLDEEAGAVAGLSVNSLSEEDFAAYTEDDVAADLVALLRAR